MQTQWRRTFYSTICIGFVFHGFAAYGQSIYWTNRGTDEIYVGRTDGYSLPVVLYDSTDGVDEPNGIAVDPSAGMLYWANEGTNEIIAGSVNGSSPATVLFDPSDTYFVPVGVAVDAVNGRIYWTSCCGGGRIYSGNIDGTGTPVLLYDEADGIESPHGLDIDVTNGILYWSDITTNEINSGSMDGLASKQTVLDFDSHEVFTPYDVRHVASSGRLIWSDNTSRILAANDDGSGPPSALFASDDGLLFPTGLAVDADSGGLYWVDLNTHDVRVGNLSGAGSPTVLYDQNNGVLSPFYMALAPDTPSGITVGNTSEAFLAAMLLLVTAAVFLRYRCA